MRAVTGAVLDLCCVGAFVAIGRASQGTAAAFIVVALAFPGLFLLGWRLLAARFGTSSAMS